MGGSVGTKSLRHLAVVAATLVILLFAFAPAAFAGGCDPDDEDCDSGSAGGGVGTGYVVDTASFDRGDVLLTLALAGGGIALITAGGLAVRRQNS
jgi:hypothetical protein